MDINANQSNCVRMLFKYRRFDSVMAVIRIFKNIKKTRKKESVFESIKILPIITLKK